jgi:hypothetical protein
MTDLATLYQTDYSAWAKRNAELLRARHFDALDIEHLLEELSDMSKSGRRELHSRLLVLIAHLLKWEFQYQNLAERWREFDGRSWRSTIIQQREQIADLLAESPGLKSQFDEAIAGAYSTAVRLAHKETRLPLATFPTQCPYAAEQLLDDNFFPGVPPPPA